MSIRSNVMIALAICLAFSCQVYAAENEKNRGKRPMRPSFASIDSNDDGEIGFDEFSLQELPHGEHQTVFDDIDADSDSVISCQEFADHKPPRR